MKLELKHISPYLPYGLKGVLVEDKTSIFHDEIWFDDESIFQPNAIWKLCGYADGDLNIPLGEGYFNGFLWRNNLTYVNFYRGIKLILRPLSDLTKEIEHNGEKIIPILELYKISVDEDIEKYKIVTGLNDPEFYTAGIRVLDFIGEYKILSFSIQNGFATQNCGYKDIISDRVVELTMNQSQLWEKLYEWHFDVFGLISQGLAVDINTLNQEK